VSDTDNKYSGANVCGAEHSSPYPVGRLAAPISLVDTAKEIEAASASVALRTNAQLEVVLEQMRVLQQRAREIIDQAARDVDLIHVECRFRRVPGRTLLIGSGSRLPDRLARHLLGRRILTEGRGLFVAPERQRRRQGLKPEA
jgi:hypothetical protein